MNTAQIVDFSFALDSELSGIKGVCFDIDDTLSSHGKLTSEAFESLWKLKSKGYALVPITGRPAGWCDHIARFWPVDAVVGENGAFLFFTKEGKLQRVSPPGADPYATQKLAQLKEKILKQFPEATFASDQFCRLNDLAIDFCEDISHPWPMTKVEELAKFCESQGAHAKISSIHVNTWYGEFNKQKGFQFLLQSGILPLKVNEWIYLGDSPNDEPMFELIDKSVGVANLKPFLPQLKKFPRWMTSQDSGSGFAAVAKRLCHLS